MNDHDAHLALIARAAGSTTASEIDEPCRSLIAPVADRIAAWLLAVAAIACVGLAVACAVTL